MPLNEYEVGKLCGKGKFSTVVTEITKSYPFMNKTNQSE